MSTRLILCVCQFLHIRTDSRFPALSERFPAGVWPVIVCMCFIYSGEPQLYFGKFSVSLVLLHHLTPFPLLNSQHHT